MLPFQLTRFAKNGGPLTKRISLAEDGQLHADGGGGQITRGRGAPSRDWREAVRRCAAQPELLTEWENNFTSLAGRRALSSKQAKVLHRLAARCSCNWEYHP
jgi:hypothetical protein